MMAKGPVYMLQEASKVALVRHSAFAVKRANIDATTRRKAQLLKGAVRINEQSISSLQTLSQIEMTEFVKLQRNMILSICEPSVRRSLAPRLRSVSISDQVRHEPTGPARRVRPTSPALQSMEADETYDVGPPSLDSMRPRTAAELRSSLRLAGAALLSSPSSVSVHSASSPGALEWQDLNSLESRASCAPGASSPASRTGLQTTLQTSPITASKDSDVLARSLKAALEVTSAMECLPPPPAVQVKHYSASKPEHHRSGMSLKLSTTAHFSPLSHTEALVQPRLTVFGTSAMTSGVETFAQEAHS